MSSELCTVSEILTEKEIQRRQRWTMVIEGSEVLHPTIMENDFMSQGYDDPTTLPRRKDPQSPQDAFAS